MFEMLNDDNVMLYAMKAYDRPDMIMSEFDEDLKRFNYLKRLFFRHRKYNEIRERLVINHIIVLYNVFGIQTATRLLFYFMENEDYSILKTYLTFLNLMPDKICGIKNTDVQSSDISLDEKLVKILRKIK